MGTAAAAVTLTTLASNNVSNNGNILVLDKNPKSQQFEKTSPNLSNLIINSTAKTTITDPITSKNNKFNNTMRNF